MRLVLDTNVVLSGLLWRSHPRHLLDLAKEGTVSLYTSSGQGWFFTSNQFNSTSAPYRRAFARPSATAHGRVELGVAGRQERYGLGISRIIPNSTLATI